MGSEDTRALVSERACGGDACAVARAMPPLTDSTTRGNFPRRKFLPPKRSRMRAVFFWIAVLSCIAGQAMILRSTLRARAHRAPAEGVASPRLASELAWAVLPAVMLAATLVVTWRALP